MKREIELLIKGANIEIIKVLRDFNDTMNATLGDTVTITSNTGVITRKATLRDTIEFYQDEWCRVLEKLNELGIEI
ncbi:hypothetical protein DIC82_05275 [Clostridium beijerinckii]|nr:hypothetical protein DIC82_05275 [Clostridium beijerinckii]